MTTLCLFCPSPENIAMIGRTILDSATFVRSFGKLYAEVIRDNEKQYISAWSYCQLRIAQLGIVPLINHEVLADPLADAVLDWIKKELARKRRKGKV